MATASKKTRHTYVFEFSEEELKVLSNVFYRVQMKQTGPGKIASDIATEIEKYCYVDQYDHEGRPNYIEMYESEDFGPSLYWDDEH